MQPQNNKRPVVSKNVPKKNVPKSMEYDMESDSLGAAFDDGDLVSYDDICDTIVNVVDFERREGLYGEYYTVHTEDGRLFNVGSQPVRMRLDKIYEQLPMELVFLKKDLEGGKKMFSVVKV